MPLFSTFNTMSVRGYSQTNNNFIDAKLEALINEGIKGDRLGIAVDITQDGSTVVIGASGSPGAAYVYTKTGTTWSLVIKLVPPTGVINSNFGASVTISKDGNYIAIGSPSETIGTVTNKGAVYRYKKTAAGWNFIQKLTAADGNVNALYGQSVSMDKTGALVVTSPGVINDTASFPGAAYVYYAAGNETYLSQKITQQKFNSYADAQFAFTARLSGNGTTLIIGSYKIPYITIYEGSAGTFALKIGFQGPGNVGPGGSYVNAWIGYSVAVNFNGDTIGYGAPLKDGVIKDYSSLSSTNNKVAVEQGSVYFRKRTVGSWGSTTGTTGNQITVGYAISAYSILNFGHSLDISDDGSQALVGAYRTNVSTVTSQGDAHKLLLNPTGTSWGTNIKQQYNFVAPDGKANDRFGSAVAMDGSGVTNVIGAPTGDFTKPGSVYIYTDP